MKPWLAQRAARTPRSPALLYDGQTLDWAETARRAGVRAAWLARHGIRRGDTVALTPGPDALENALWIHAVPWCGAVLFPLPRSLPPERRAAAVDRFNAALHLELADAPDIKAQHDALAPAEVDPGDPATLLLTSGSSGAPRGVPMSSRQHRASVAAVGQRLSLGAEDRWLACLPPEHIGGLSILFRAVLTGAVVHLLDRFDAGQVARILDREPVHWMSLVPTQLADLLAIRERPFQRRLRGVLVGGAAARPELLAKAWTLNLPALPTWGMTEAGSQLATAVPESAARIDWARQPGRVGPALPGVEIRLIADQRLQVRGPMLFSGYAGQADDRGRSGPDADGWFTTGDRGRLDEHGNLVVLGRADRVLVSGGVNVSLDAVEQCLLESKRVVDVALIARPDARWGQVPVALVVLAPAQSPEALRAWCREHLTPAERPAQLVAVERIPRGPAGKPLHEQIAGLLAD